MKKMRRIGVCGLLVLVVLITHSAGELIASESFAIRGESEPPNNEGWVPYSVYHPEITRGYMYPPGELLYNHDASIEFFQGRFYGAWNGNTNRWEARPGQLNYWAVSDDGLNWSEAREFERMPFFGNPDWQTEWQPNLLNWNDEELWCFWTKSGAFIFSKLNAEKDGWDHHLIWEDIDLKGKRFWTFPTQEPTVLDDGTVLIPAVFRQPAEDEPVYDKRTYYSGPIITRDGGQTFFVPEGALIEHPEVDASFKMWEPMYVVQDDGAVRMFNRTYSIGKTSCEMPVTALITAVGSADGEQMGSPYYSAIRTLHSRMWLGTVGSRRLMVHHDSLKNWFPRDRINIALFSSRTGRDDFVAGIPIEDGFIGIAYPQAVFVSNAAYVVYTHQNDPATIVVNKVDPLPAEDQWYLFPRSGNRSLTGNDAPRPVPSSFIADANGGGVSTGKLTSERLSSVFWLRLDKPTSGTLFQYGRFKVSLDQSGRIRVTDGDRWGEYSRPLPVDGRWLMLAVEYDLVGGWAALSVNAGHREEWTMTTAQPEAVSISLMPGIAGVRLGRADIYQNTVLPEDTLVALFNRKAWVYGMYPLANTEDQVPTSTLVFCPAGASSGFQPVDDDRLEPGYIEFYAASEEVRAGPPNELGTNSVTITGWVSNKPKSDGVLFNALSSDGKSGFSLRFNFNGNLNLLLGGPNGGKDIMTPNPLRVAGLTEPEGWDYGPWVFFAVVLNNETGEVRFWNNGSLGLAREGFDPGMNWSTGEAPSFARSMPRETVINHYPLYARVHQLQVYDRALRLDELAWDYEKGPEVRSWGRATSFPGPAVWSLSAESYDERFDSAKMRRPLAAPVILHQEHKILVGGNAAVGVDLDRFDPEQDAVEVLLPVRVALPQVSETMVMMTLGDDNQIALGLRRDNPDQIHVRTGGIWKPATHFDMERENIVRVHMDKDQIIVENEGETAVIPNLGGISQRLYLGDGYPESYIAPADRFEINVRKFSARVITGEKKYSKKKVALDHYDVIMTI